MEDTKIPQVRLRVCLSIELLQCFNRSSSSLHAASTTLRNAAFFAGMLVEQASWWQQALVLTRRIHLANLSLPPCIIGQTQQFAGIKRCKELDDTVDPIIVSAMRERKQFFLECS